MQGLQGMQGYSIKLLFLGILCRVCRVAPFKEDHKKLYNIKKYKNIIQKRGNMLLKWSYPAYPAQTRVKKTNSFIIDGRFLESERYQ